MKIEALLISLILALTFAACKHISVENNDENPHAKTPVTISRIEKGNIVENIRLSATSTYQKKDQVKANVTGYIERCYVHIGEFVEAGKPLFSIRTKEAEALGKFHSNDSTYKLKGLLEIKAPESGIITEVNKYLNDYVAEGDAMLTIAQQNSMIFLMNVPFELKKYTPIGASCTVLLPDSTKLSGNVGTQLSTVDPITQTQVCEVKVPITKNFPENLLATVLLVKNIKHNTQIVDKSSVLSDEMMENFWVMKLLNDSTAAKVVIKKGISDGDKIEIISPLFDAGDRIIYSGHYGLADTAFILINK